MFKKLKTCFFFLFANILFFLRKKKENVEILMFNK